jgi:hypothetical protein
LINNNLLVDVLGWAGAFAVLIAYALVSSKRVSGDSTSYQILNLAGSTFLIINTIHYGAYPSTFVNIAWFCIAACSIINCSFILPRK